ncbi:hypothetical protein BN1263370003 [Stenotrophomonas thermophila]|nr:hypothetical protein BN1263370003 [Stenotrophomonas maltophilia]
MAWTAPSRGLIHPRMAWIYPDMPSGVIVGAGSDELFQPRKQVGDVDDLALLHALEQQGAGADLQAAVGIAQHRVDAPGIGHLHPGQARHALGQSVTECHAQCFPAIAVGAVDQLGIDHALQCAGGQGPLHRQRREAGGHARGDQRALVLQMRLQCSRQGIETGGELVGHAKAPWSTETTGTLRGDCCPSYGRSDHVSMRDARKASTHGVDLLWSVRFALYLPPQLAGQCAHGIIGVRAMQQADLVVVDHRQLALSIDDAVLAADRAAWQQADADAIGHRALDATQRRTGEGNAPTQAQGFHGVDHLVAVQPSRREGDQRQRVLLQAAAAQAVDPVHRLAPAMHRLATVAALLDQHQVQLAVVEALRQVTAEAAADLQLHLRVAAAEGGQHAGGLRVDEVLRYADADRGFHRRAGQRLCHFLVQVEHAPRVAEQGVAGIGGVHVAMAALEQAMPGQFLQPPHLLADRGLGRMQARGRRGETAAVGHHHQRPQQVQFEQGSIRFGTVLHLNISLLDTQADFYHAGQGPAMRGCCYRRTAFRGDGHEEILSCASIIPLAGLRPSRARCCCACWPWSPPPAPPCPGPTQTRACGMLPAAATPMRCDRRSRRAPRWRRAMARAAPRCCWPRMATTWRPRVR